MRISCLVSAFVALVLTSLSTISAAQAASLNCASFWAASAGEDIPCEEFTSTGFPATIGGAEIRIFHYSDGWNDELGQRQLLAAVSDAARNSAYAYGSWYGIPRLYFILHNEFTTNTYAQAHWHPASNPEPCRIDLFLNIPNNRDLAMQIAAHEIFHCVQAHSLKFPTSTEVTQGLNSWSWWAEGSATWAASQTFPAGRAELSDGALFKPQLPLYRQPRAYSTVVFWDYLFKNEYFSFSQIGALLKSQPEQSTFIAERQALGQYPDIDRIFNRFATHVVDRDIKNVTNTKYDLPIVAFGTPVEFDVTWDHLDQPVIPFTVNTGAIHFPTGTKLKWGLPADAAAKGIQISMRLKGDPFWQNFKPGDLMQINVKCNTEGGETYEFVITSTADSSDSVTAHMTFQDTRAQDCFCKDTGQPLDPCLNGKWELDDAALSAFYTRTFQMYKRIDITGLFKFNISVNPAKSSNMELNQYRTYILMSQSDSETLDQEVNANGTIETKILMQKKGELCMRPGVANGTYTHRFGNTSWDGSLAELITADPEYPEPRWRYTCDARHLHFESYVGEGLTFEWEFNKKP